MGLLVIYAGFSSPDTNLNVIWGTAVKWIILFNLFIINALLPFIFSNLLEKEFNQERAAMLSENKNKFSILIGQRHKLPVKSLYKSIIN